MSGDGGSCDTLERDGDRAYFTDADGVRYRVHDVAFGPPLSPPHRRRILALESPAANHRYFVPALGVPRVYRFTKGESRELTPERLALQLRGAGFVATTGPTRGASRPT